MPDESLEIQVKLLFEKYGYEETKTAMDAVKKEATGTGMGFEDMGKKGEQATGHIRGLHRGLHMLTHEALGPAGRAVNAFFYSWQVGLMASIAVAIGVIAKKLKDVSDAAKEAAERRKALEDAYWKGSLEGAEKASDALRAYERANRNATTAVEQLKKAEEEALQTEKLRGEAEHNLLGAMEGVALAAAKARGDAAAEAEIKRVYEQAKAVAKLAEEYENLEIKRATAIEADKKAKAAGGESARAFAEYQDQIKGAQAAIGQLDAQLSDLEEQQKKAPGFEEAKSKLPGLRAQLEKTRAYYEANPAATDSELLQRARTIQVLTEQIDKFQEALDLHQQIEDARSTKKSYEDALAARKQLYEDAQKNKTEMEAEARRAHDAMASAARDYASHFGDTARDQRFKDLEAAIASGRISPQAAEQALAGRMPGAGGGIPTGGIPYRPLPGAPGYNPAGQMTGDIERMMRDIVAIVRWQNDLTRTVYNEMQAIRNAHY